ncbi:hypothetical protein Tco_0870050, partial [Tanacetum coccineum]
PKEGDIGLLKLAFITVGIHTVEDAYPACCLSVVSNPISYTEIKPEGKWGTSPPAGSGAGPSSITAGATTTTDQAQRKLARKGQKEKKLKLWKINRKT